MEYIVAVVALVFLFLYWRLADRLRAAWIIRKLPTPAGSLLGGHVSVLSGRYAHRFVQKWARELGSIFRVRTVWEQVFLGPALNLVSSPAMPSALTLFFKNGRLKLADGADCHCRGPVHLQ